MENIYSTENNNLRVFIGKIHLKVNEETLYDHFSKFGEIISVEIKKHKKSQVSKRFGFINCRNKETYSKILQSKHSILGGEMNCNVAFKCKNKQSWGTLPKTKIFINGITNAISDHCLNSYFRKYGPMIRVYGIRDAADNEAKGFGFIEFRSNKSIQKCVEDSPHFLKGIRITTDIYKPNKQVVLSNKNKVSLSNYKPVLNLEPYGRCQGIIAFDNKLCSVRLNTALFNKVPIENSVDQIEDQNYSFQIEKQANYRLRKRKLRLQMKKAQKNKKKFKSKNKLPADY